MSPSTRMRVRPARALVARCLALLAAGCLAAAGPGVAAAQTPNPFNGLPPVQPSTPTVAPATSTPQDRSNGLKGWQEALIVFAGIALILGIGFAIVGDAHRQAPVTEDEHSGAHRSSAAGARKAHSKAKARKQGKASRAARRRNR